MSMPYSHEIKLTRPERYTTMPDSDGEWTIDRCLAQVVTLTYHEVVSLIYWAAEVGQWTSEPSFILFDGSSDQLKRRAFDTVFYQGGLLSEEDLEYDRFTALWELWISADTTTRAKFLLAFHQDRAYREHVDEWLNRYDAKREAQAKADEEAGIYERGIDDDADYDDREYDLALLRTYGVRMWGTRYCEGFGPEGKIANEAGGVASVDGVEGDRADPDVDIDEDGDWEEEDVAELTPAPEAGAVRHVLGLATPAPASAPTVTGRSFERFTDRANRVMQIANQEAQRFNHEYIGTEHILLGLVKEGDCFGAKYLHNAGASAQRVRSEIERLVQMGPELVTMGRLPITPRAKAVVEFAKEEASKLNHNFVGTEHILLGLIREAKGVAAQVLGGLGVTLDEVRAAICGPVNAAAIPDYELQPETESAAVATV